MTSSAKTSVAGSLGLLSWSCLAFAVLLALPPADAEAHSGRRFLIEVVGGKLQAQGINTGPDDGAPALRDYVNSIHDHWRNVDSLGIATATLPGFDVTPSAASELLGQGLELSLRSVSRWRPPMPQGAAAPVLEPLAPGQLVSVQGPTGVVDSTTLGAFTLVEDMPFGGIADIDPIYSINCMPSGEIHVLEFLMHAVPVAGQPSSVTPSDPIHVLLSPDGSNPVERLHHAALFLERHLATVPEPSTAYLASLLASFHATTGLRIRPRHA